MSVNYAGLTIQCLKCGWKWKARKKVPRACPKCKRYDWNLTFAEPEEPTADPKRPRISGMAEGRPASWSS